MNLPRDGLTGTGTVSGGGGIFGSDSFAETATDTCDVQENEGTSDGMGGTGDEWVTIASYACRVSPLTPRMEATEAEKIAAVGRYLFVLPSDAVISAANRIVYNSNTFEVENVGRPIINNGTIKVYARFIG